MLKEKESGLSAVLIVVGKAFGDRILCGPQGNHVVDNRFNTPLSKAKFVLLLGKPDIPVYASDWAEAFATLSKVQGGISKTSTRKNFLIGEGDGFTNMRFTTNVFQKRSSVSDHRCTP